MRIAAIDQGTTSTRVIGVGDDGQPRVIHAITHRQFFPQAGWVEHDPEELIRNIRLCINAAGKLDAIGIANQGESCLAWDAKTKTALSPVIVWQDDRTRADIEKLRENGAGSMVRDHAGLPLDPYFSAAKLGWLLQNMPAVKSAHAAGTLRLGTTDAFFLDRLTGRFVTDVTTASRSSLMNLQTLSWDPELCALFGVPMACLPDIVTTTGDFGMVETLHGATPVTASIVDQQAALYGSGCRTAGDAKITFGTGAFALMVAGPSVVRQNDPVVLPTVAWQMCGQPPVYALEGGVFAASAAINWARSLGLFQDFLDINRFDAPPAIASGLAFVPALTGLGCPHWVSDARGVWLGLSLDHSPQQLVQSILEGVALRAVEVIEALDACVPLCGGLAIDGGLSKNAYFAKFLANVSGRQVHAAVMPEMTGQGVLQLAGMQLGERFDFASDATIYESERTDGLYRERFTRAVNMSKAWAGT